MWIGSAAATLAMPFAARATDDQVAEAMAADYGAMTPPDGDVVIDMPDYSDSGKSVPLTVRVPCTMEGDDYPDAVSIYASRNPRPRVCRVHFTPACAEATFSTRIRIDSYQDITAVVRMADGRTFRGVRKVDVTYGACEEAIANDQFPPGWTPKIRVSVPKDVAPGDAAEIRTIIGHPMETGFRYNSRGLIIPVRIAETFKCVADGETAFAVKLEPAIAANPYFAFKLRAEHSTDLHFEWVDTSLDVYTAEAKLTVS